MRTEEEESSPRTSGGDKGKKKRKRTSHNHIGPNVRAFRAGLAFCSLCDADKIVRLTDKERESEKVAQQAAVKDSKRK